MPILLLNGKKEINILEINKNLHGVSLFASGGIGDLALRGAGVSVIVANEILKDRVQLFKNNFPETLMLEGDIWQVKESIVENTLRILDGKELDFLLATPPCQGMSKNGRGKLLSMVRNHGKPEFDVRNQLIIPTVEIIKKLRPRIVVMENVPEMENTVIPIPGDGERLANILDFVAEQLSDEYVGHWEVVEFANYGVPQRRQRLITVFTRDPVLISYYRTHNYFLPSPTHSEKGSCGTKKWMSVRDAISHLPSLNAGEKSTAIHPVLALHDVPLLDEEKYFWVSNTPHEKGAFDNQCVNQKCMYDANPVHGSYRTDDGINRAKETTPLYCVKCGEVLPRPWVGSGNDRRLMKGFTSAYKRMSWDMPASTITTNFAYACSDNKLHPEQHRTLSTLEALILHTIDQFPYEFRYANGKKISKKTVRDVIGESVPPAGLKVIFDHLLCIMSGVVVNQTTDKTHNQSGQLFGPIGSFKEIVEDNLKLFM